MSGCTGIWRKRTATGPVWCASRMQSGQYREERQFLLKEDVAGPAAIDPALLQGLPDNLELVRAETSDPESHCAGIARNSSESTAATRSNAFVDAPGRSLRNGAPVEDRQPVLLADRRTSSRRGESARKASRREMQQMLSELETELQSLGSASLVQCRSSQLDTEGYVRAQDGFVLKTSSTNLDRLKQVIQSQYNRLYHGGQPANWTRGRVTPKCWARLSPVALETQGSLFALETRLLLCAAC